MRQGIQVRLLSMSRTTAHSLPELIEPSSSPKDGSPRSALIAKELGNYGGNPDEDIPLNMIMFYQAIYGLRANGLSKFAPANEADGRGEGEYYKAYYELIEQLMRSGLFTQVAHPDTIKLFDIYPSYDLVPTYEKLAKLAVEQDLYMEDNTGCHYRYHTADIGLSDAFLRVLIDQQAKIMTASDAHVPEHVGNFIPEACEKIRQMEAQR